MDSKESPDPFSFILTACESFLGIVSILIGKREVLCGAVRVGEFNGKQLGLSFSPHGLLSYKTFDSRNGVAEVD